MKIYTCAIVVVIAMTITTSLKGQLDDACKLNIGTNLSGMADFGTENPFVDVMKNCRTWYTKDLGNPNDPFNSGHAQELSYRTDGYPTHSPQTIATSPYPQIVVTIWANTSGWTAGEYVVLWDGTGVLEFVGSGQNVKTTGPNRMTFDLPNPEDGTVEMRINSSDINDPLRNIRVLMPGSESTYMQEPFNPVWLQRALDFRSIRFMDWAQTNNWGHEEGNNNWTSPDLYDWDDRAMMDHYTWAFERGIPYEMMVKLMNDYDLDGWVCVPHRASNDYMSNMAEYFRDNLEPERHLTVEYSNEIWNWIFAQTHWVNEYGCEQTGDPWPEGIAPFVQNCLDHFTTAYAGQLHRITRAVGAFTGWLDISERIIGELTPGSFDALALTYYFGIPESGDEVLDSLGASATVADIAMYAREGMHEAYDYIEEHKNAITDPLGIELNFYEGGHHLTPHPFGVEPTYGDALLDIMRDTAMYNLYNEWFDTLRTIQVGPEPLHLMNFSFVSPRSAQFGSWGILESIDQDTSVIPAPKYSSVLENMAKSCCTGTSGVSTDVFVANDCITLHPNPTVGHFTISGNLDLYTIEVLSSAGNLYQTISTTGTSVDIDISTIPSGLHFISIRNTNNGELCVQKILKTD